MAELDSLQLSITPERRHPRKMTYADLNRLTYLQATIKVACTPCTAMWMWEPYRDTWMPRDS